MAKTKVRRIIRKRKLAQAEPFDEQLWPIQLTLFLLGGFLIGLVLAYLRFNDLRWWANALTWLLITPAAIGALMVLARFVDRRLMRRAVQLSLALCLLIHLILAVVMYESVIFSRFFPENREVANVTHERAVIPDYHRFPTPEQRQQQDFLQPVETETPEPEEQQELQQEPIDEPQPVERVQPQPEPVPEPQPAVQPAEVEQRRPLETAPRMAQQQSQLSRQTTQTAPQSIVAAVTAPNSPRPSSQQASTPQPTAAPLERQATDTRAQRRPTPTEPTTSSEKSEVQLARREAQPSLVPESTAAPTLQRRLADPEITPRTEVAPAPQVAAARQTQTAATLPDRVAMTRVTAAPAVQAPTAVESPEAPSQSATEVQLRQVDSSTAPAVAQAPAVNAQERRPTPIRPEVAMPAELPAPSVAPQPAPAAQPSITPQTNPIQRRSADSLAQRPAPVETPSPTAAESPNSASLARRETQQDSPTASATAAAQPARRRASQETAFAATQAQTSNAPGAAESAAPVAPQPSSTAVARQATASPAIATSAAPSTSPATSSETPTASRSATRSLPAESAPTVAQTPSPQPSQRRAVQANPHLSEIAATPAPAAAPAVAAPAAEIRPTTSTVAQQVTSSPAVSQNPLLQNTPSSSPSLSAARPSPTRAQTAALPSANPQAAPAASPARSATIAAAPASPAPVESPAFAEAARSSSQPSLQPSQMALSRGETGTAGVGASVNLDRAAPTSAGASAVASASAARATSQSQERGPELSPSAPALVARANAGDPAPSATLLASDAAVPNTLGAEQPAETNASASAALVRADSQAEASPLSAAAGAVEVDLGPTRIVATEGASRASGGGQPELNPEQQSRLTARGAASGAPPIALATVETADAPAAPAGTGGGEPPRPNPQIDAVAAVSANPGGVAAITGGPSAAIETGPTSETSGATSVAPTQVARAETLEAPPGAAQAGGGRDDPNVDDQPAQLARAATGGNPGAASTTAELMAAGPSSAPGTTGSPEEDEEEDRLAALAALKGAAGPADIGGMPAAGGPTGAALAGPPSESTSAARTGAARTARAEMVAAAPGAPEAGGGSLSRTRASAGPQFAATAIAEAPSLAGSPASAGQPDAAPLAAAGDLDAPAVGGMLAQAIAGPQGALEGPEASDAPAGDQPGPQLGRRAVSSATVDGPLMATDDNAGSPGRRQTQVALAGGLNADAAPSVPAATPSGDGSVPDMATIAGRMDDMGEMDMSQLALEAASGARPVSVAAPDGVGGLSETPTPDVGLADRRGQPDAEVIHFRDARFIRRDVGGTPAVNLTAVAPAEAFAQRMRPKSPGDQAGGGGPPPLTEEAIEAGLAFLAKHQMPDGSWSFSNFGRGQAGYENEMAVLDSDTAATGLALLAFQGGGYTHQHGKYRDTVRKAIEFLVKNQREDGDLYIRTGGPSDAAMWIYSQGVATLALCEAYGMTQDPAVKQPTQRAIDFIVSAQTKTRGGWRYSPNYGADTSVTGWMMMALKSGELAGLNVPSETFRGVEKWLDAAQKSDRDRHLYVYNPLAPDTPQQRHGRRPNPTMTSVGLLMRLYTGWKRDNVHLVAGAEYLLSNPPANGTRREPQRDAYYWYYATQVLFHMGGEYWKAWNEQLHPMLIQSQEKAGSMAGSWDPRAPVPDRWGPHCGRLYVTTLNLLSLEVYYRHLPLYVETAK